MSVIRATKTSARWVLAWFALYLATAIASPLLKSAESAEFQMVCLGSGGMKMVALDLGDGQPQPSMGMDCPLCASVLPPPPEWPQSPVIKTSSLAHALEPIESARLAYLTAPPLPSRGPPRRLT